MVGHNIALLLYRNTLALLCAVSINASPTAVPIRHCEPAAVGGEAKQSHKIASSPLAPRNDERDLWRYLRAGINYLEASGRDLPTHYRHPGGKAYGPLALTPIAIKDVRFHYPLLSPYTLDDVLSDRALYDKFAAAYAELLLKHYFKIDYQSMPKEEVFEALQKGWFLGPTLYKKGRPVIVSRQRRAAEYIDSPTIII